MRADGDTNVTLLAGHGTAGSADRSVDRIIAWASMERIPDAYVRQAVPGAVMVRCNAPAGGR
ncbi:hypothetical protein [Nonomuraea sp. NPDC049400]|uniref:hypothetical protein n=1 Tax=Nonomuraea sp. NPDC049400 TaxID=3364352 RepID=UPI0037AD97BE